jgi:CcmD family protein
MRTKRLCRTAAAWLLAGGLVLGAAAPAGAQPQGPPGDTAAPQATPRPADRQPPLAAPSQQDEFVPVDQLPGQEQFPATPLVTIAYAAAWLVIFFYLWSIWRRLGRVERDLAEVGRRVQGTGRR